MPDNQGFSQRQVDVFGWSVFGLCVGLLGYGFSQQIARTFDFSAFYTAGHVFRISAARLFDMGLQASVQQQFVSSDRVMPFYHPAYEALLYVPFSVLSFRAAYVAYLISNLVLLALVYRLGPAPTAPCLQRLPRMLLFFASVPVLFCLAEGQNSILFLLLLVGVWRFIERGAYLNAGLLLGAGMFKLAIAPIFAILLALRLGWRFLTGAALSGSGVILFSIALTGVRGAKAWFDLMWQAAAAPTMDAHTQNVMRVVPQGMTNINGLLYLFSSAVHLRAPAIYGLAASGCLLVVCAMLVRSVHRIADAFSIAIAGALLVGPHVLLHDMVLMLLPVLLSSGALFGYWTVMSYILPFASLVIVPPRALAFNALVPLLFVVFSAHKMCHTKMAGEALTSTAGKITEVPYDRPTFE